LITLYVFNVFILISTFLQRAAMLALQALY